MDYQDFDLSIESLSTAGQRYRVNVLSSPAGQASAEFTLPFSAQDLEIFFLRVGRPRRSVRSLHSAEGLAAQSFGHALYEAAFTGDVKTCLWRSLDTMQAQGKGLRIRLRLNDAPQLTELPWEFLYDASHKRFFAHSPATPIIRYLNLPQREGPLSIPPPLRVLVMIANPHDATLGELDVEAEWQKVQQAISRPEARGLMEVTRLEAATLSALQRQLRQTTYHIFHFIGHGGFDPQTQEGVLLLEDEQGRSRLVSGHHLGTLLRDHGTLRLAVLNACEGARTALDDPFAGVAQHLVQQGIPAVLAMQFEITDRAAIALADEFYAALTDGYPVDAALAEARKAVFALGNDVEWGTPVLYMRAIDGQLFSLTTSPSISPAPSPIKPKTKRLTPVSPGRHLPAWLWTFLIVVVMVGGLTLGRNLLPITLDPETILGLIGQAAATPNPHPTLTARSLPSSARATSLPTEEPIEEPTPTRRLAEEAPTATPSLLPDPLTGRLAFSVGGGNGPGGNVYIINADGSNLYQLPGEGFDREAAWSPSGDQLALTGYRNGAWGLYLIEPDGSNVRPLITNENYISSPAWSSDGQKIAFSFSAQDAVGIYVINNDGTGLQRLTSSSSTQDRSPTWSPDGKRLAYVSQDDGFMLYTTDPDGGNRITMARDVVGPDWSPDGQFIVYRGTPPAIFKLPVNTPSMPQLLTKRTVSFVDGADLDGYPAWSPDGQAIAFYSQRSGKVGIYVMSIDGTDERLITNTPFAEGQFGERISWTQ